MGKKPKPKEEGEKGNGSSDIFKILFGGGSPEELGLGSGSNPRNADTEIHGQLDRKETELDLAEVKKKKKEKGKKPDLDTDMPDSIDIGSENPLEAKKRKGEKERNSNSDFESIGRDEVKKRRKEEEREPNLDVVSIEKSLKRDDEERMNPKKANKKKRKRDEIEEEYEARNYEALVKVEGKEVAGLGRKVVGEKRKTVDDPADMMVSKEGFDNESKLLRTIFVGNLPLKTKKKALLKEFSQFGEVESVRIRSVPLLDSKTPRKGAILKGKINESVDSVHAYIVFKDEQSAQASLSHNMAMVGGNHVRVDIACPPRKKLKGENAPLYDNKRTVFMGNLPFDVKDEELYQLFCGMSQLESSIEAVRVIRDPHTSVGKGIAYVLFKTRDAANLVIKKRHLKLRDRDLRVYHARSDSTPSKKRNRSPASANHAPAKRLAVGSNGTPTDRNKANARATLSYQGLQASKSGIQKKVGFRPKIGEQGKQTSRIETGVEKKERKGKRPAVAARKATVLKGSGAPKQMGQKRKLESRTPESSHRKKKARKFR